MTPDRDPAPTPSPADRERPAVVAAAEIAATDGVPAPRPEILARVLDRLRELPEARTPAPRGPAVDDGLAAAARDAGVPQALLPLPRRRS